MSYLFRLFYLKIHHIQASCLLDVDAIEAEESISDRLSAISDDGVAHTLGNNLNRHAGFNANAIDLLTVLGGNLEHSHDDSVLDLML